MKNIAGTILLAATSLTSVTSAADTTENPDLLQKQKGLMANTVNIAEAFTRALETKKEKLSRWNLWQRGGTNIVILGIKADCGDMTGSTELAIAERTDPLVPEKAPDMDKIKSCINAMYNAGDTVTWKEGRGWKNPESGNPLGRSLYTLANEWRNLNEQPPVDAEHCRTLRTQGQNPPACRPFN
ncbi:MAG: hypothetical protein H6853_08235 [Rhodospirillales bacterium]|nr:hypothetical protein [Alphaproteobacteria bacterium]USO03498.1 MAG: hypothetical protein H6853_08235 [Rhodospirillales bacterium]